MRTELERVVKSMTLERFTTFLELFGAVLICCGVSLWSIPAGLIAAGVALIVVGFLAAEVPEGRG